MFSCWKMGWKMLKIIEIKHQRICSLCVFFFLFVSLFNMIKCCCCFFLWIPLILVFFCSKIYHNDINCKYDWKIKWILRNEIHDTNGDQEESYKWLNCNIRKWQESAKIVLVKIKRIIQETKKNYIISSKFY